MSGFGLVRLGDSGGSHFRHAIEAVVEAHFQAHWRHRKCKVFPDLDENVN
jgi:hypothetical protein